MEDIFAQLRGNSTRQKKKSKEEAKLSYQIAAYLNIQYPDVVFRFDIAADIKLTMGQASIVKSKLKHRRGYHDLTILEPKGGYNGLLIELKKSRDEVYLKGCNTLRKKWNSKTQSDHNVEQSEHLSRMGRKGYLAEYGFGFLGTKNLIDNYMKLK